ncbi:MAG: DUF523 domain-containing protein [Clostridia bacterium]|nr:DUF523 domain-containing protein [Clostridia bacterium]
MNILISACLLGCACRYDGKSKTHPAIEMLRAKHTLIPICPEIYGGLPTPRPPSEIVGDRVQNSAGTDVTDAYRRGAEEALRLAELFGCKVAVLKAKSPSCGKGKVYDGTFSRTLTDGDGVTAALLQKHGIKVYTEDEIAEIL